MRLYLAYLRILVKSQLQYRSTFLFLLLGQTVIPLAACFGIVMMFARFGSVGGWTVAEAMLCFGVTHLAMALATLIARGFDTFGSMVASGEFDRVLVRPRGTILQVLGSKLDLSRFGRAIQGVAVLAWALSRLDIPWDPARLLTLGGMIICGTTVFSGIYILGASLAFRTIQGLELVNIFTDGGREAAQYPITIYPRQVGVFFTFAIPFACFNYLPLLYLLDKPGSDPVIGMLAPWLGCLFLLPCLLAWRSGVKTYLSSGS